MFKPNFSYNNKIVNTLIEINSIRDFIVNAPLVVEMEISLKKDALLKSAHHSTAIEGNPLTLNQVDRLAQGLKIRAHEKARQEVLNYLNVLENLDKYLEDSKITVKTILKLHRDITHYTLEETYMEGQFRTEPVHIVNKQGEIVFTPPSANLVRSKIQNFIKWINERSGELNPVITAGIIHYEFVRIHPFVDGNGRTTRALTALLLYLRGFNVNQFITLDEYYDYHRSAYYRALNSVDHETLNLTSWLEYFLEGFLISISKIKDQILMFSPAKERKRIRLSEKQMKIIEYIHLNGSITNSELQKLLNISRQGSYKYLRSLMDLNLVEKKGGSRSTYYILKGAGSNE